MHPKQTNPPPAAEWTAAMAQRCKNRNRRTLREQLPGLICVSIIVASIVTFAIAVFSGAGR